MLHLVAVNLENRGQSPISCRAENSSLDRTKSGSDPDFLAVNSFSMLAARPAIRSLSASKIRELFNAGLGRSDILPFWVGEPDEPTPEFISRAGVNALMLATQLLVEPGERVVEVVPLWPNLQEIPRILGAHVETVAL